MSLLEARSRFGGRVQTLAEAGAECDLGPSWFWSGQPLIAGLLGHFDIPYFEQYADGHLLFQYADGAVVKAGDPSPMTGSLRIDGGVGRLTEAIANEIDPANRLLNHVVTGLTTDGDAISVDVIAPLRGDDLAGQAGCRSHAAPPSSRADVFT